MAYSLQSHTLLCADVKEMEINTFIILLIAKYVA